MNKKTVAFSKESSNLFFHILTNCNLSCKHCYINREQHGEETLSIDTIRAWLHLFSKKCDQINVIFLGGEPTLHPDLSLAVKEAKSLGFNSITIDTNGYLFHDIINKITPHEVDFISFSLDGATEETNDTIRGKGCYKTVCSGVKKAVEAGFSTSLIYTVSGENIHELPMMPKLLKQLKIDHFFIQVIGIRGKSTGAGQPAQSDHAVYSGQLPLFSHAIEHPNVIVEDSMEKNNPPPLQVTTEQWLDTVPAVAAQVADNGITVTYPKVFLEPDEAFKCAGVVADNYFIFPNGRIYRCPICEDYPVHSMEIQNNSIITTNKINETDLFELTIPEGCVMNRLIQPGNISYHGDGTPCHQIACCMLKEEIS